MVLPFFSCFEFALGSKYCESWLVFEPNCAYVISLYCFYCRKNKWHIRVKSSVVDSAAYYSSSWDQAKGIIMFIYAMHISEICSSHCSGMQTQVILWQLITAVIRNLIKYPLILPFSESISSGGWLGFSISLFTQSHIASKAWVIFSSLWSIRYCSSASQSSGMNRPAAWADVASKFLQSILNVLKKKITHNDWARKEPGRAGRLRHLPAEKVSSSSTICSSAAGNLSS